MENNGSNNANKLHTAKTAFRDAIKGYNKEDVNSYLEDMNLRFSSTEEDYKRIIYSQKQTIEGMEFKIENYDQLCKELAQLKEKMADRDNRVDTSKQKFDDYERLMKELNSRINKLTDESEKLSSKLATASAENSILIDENADLTKENRELTLKSEELEKCIEEFKEETQRLKTVIKTEPVQKKSSEPDEEQKRIYDDMSRRLGNLMIIANDNAEKLVGEAKIQAEQIILQAKTEAEKIKSDAVNERETLRENAKIKLDNALSSANEKLFSMSGDYIKNYTEYLGGVQNEFQKLIEGLRVKSSEIKAKVDNIQSMVNVELELEFERLNRDMNTDLDENYSSDTFECCSQNENNEKL